MKRIIIASLVLVALLTACIAPVAYAQEEWVTVGTFTGQGDKTTAPFQISGSKWRISWTVEADEPEYTVFGFFAYPEGETTMYVESVTQDGIGGDTTYIYQGNDSFYIKVLAANISNWTIVVEDCISAVPPPSPPAPEGEEGGGCFIATAAYGTEIAEEIDILREFRDDALLSDSFGAQFVYFYYKTSPPIADFISQHDVLRAVVREGFVDPIVVMLKWSHDLWSKE